MLLVTTGADVQPSTSRIIQSLRQTLTQRLGPRLKDRDAQDLVAAMDFALCELLHRAEDRATLRRASNDELKALLLRGYAWLDVPASPLSTDESGDAPEAESEALRHAACDLIERLPLSVQSGQDAKSRAGKEVLRDILRAHVTETLTELAPLPVETANIADPLAFDRGKLARDIEIHLQCSKTVTIESVENLSGGFSRATLAVRWSDGAQHGNLVVRKQKPAPLMSSVALDVADEFPLLSFLHAHGMAVPAQHWLQTDASVMGGDFIVMNRAGGRSLGSALGATGVNDAIMREIAEEIAR
ncbi:MAG: phosphotransferase, partial [Steroidobacteraceae bacterium]